LRHVAGAAFECVGTRGEFTNYSGVAAMAVALAEEFVESRVFGAGGSGYGKLERAFFGSGVRGAEGGNGLALGLAVREELGRKQFVVEVPAASCAESAVGGAGAGSGGGVALGSTSECCGVSRSCSSAGVRGPNYERNQANRLRKKQQKKDRKVSAEVELKSRACLDSGKYWFGVLSDGEQVELKKSRADMLRQQNLLRAQQAKDKLARIVEEKKTGLFEKKYEAERVRVEAKLSCISQQRGIVKPVGGWAATVVSSVGSSVAGPRSVPSMLSGSVSPNSSISVEALVKLEKRLLDLETREKVVVAENVKIKAEYARREKIWQSSDDMYDTPDWLRRC